MDFAFEALTSTLTSPWVYALIALAAALDSLLPIVPSETLLISAATFAAAGVPHPLGLIAAATLGALVGDLAAHLVGRSGSRRLHRWSALPRWQRLFASAQEMLARRGGSMLIVGRFVPGGRTATTIGSGMLGFRIRDFLLFDGIGSLAWAVYSTGIGLLGGKLFEGQPVLSVLTGIGVALAVSAVIEILRRIIAARSSGPADTLDGADSTHTPADVTR
jgi:membrane protein DedA with SNARE-associated domain